MKNLQAQYNEWRKEIEQFITEGENATYDAGEQTAREDFSYNFLGLKEVISFEEMLELERNY